MFAITEPIQDTFGNAQANWQFELVDPTTLAVIPLYSDYAGTQPIGGTSYITNRAVSDVYGNVQCYVAEGVYTRNYYDKSGVLRRTVPSVTYGTSFGPGPLTSGVWKPFTGLPRLKLTGTGTVTIDANTAVNGTGTTTAAVFTASPAGSTTIAFPFFGTDAVAVRATYTGTALAEII